MMRTWHPDADRQTTFECEITWEGLRFVHERAEYVIPWTTVFRVFRKACEIADDEGLVQAGAHMDNPSPGSLGEWVAQEQLPIRPGTLTPRHLSFLGPALGRLGLVERVIRGNAIYWRPSCD